MPIKPFERTEIYSHLLEEHRVISAKLELPKQVKEKIAGAAPGGHTLREDAPKRGRRLHLCRRKA